MLPAMGLPWLVGVAGALLAAHLRLGRASLLRYLRGLQRMRWLFLAILVLYVGLTPGRPVFEHLPGMSAEGLSEGARRALVLAVLLAAVFWLTQTTPMPALAGGLLWLLRPLRLLGLDHRRLGLRLALALEYAGEAGRLVGGVRQQAGGNLIEAAATAIERIETLSRQDRDEAPVPTVGMPPPWQWLLPLGLLALLAASTR